MNNSPLNALSGMLGGSDGNVLSSVLRMLGGGGSQTVPTQSQGGTNTLGGLAQMLQGFQSSGLADKVQSWIGSSQNQPVSAVEVEQAFGAEKIDQIAAESGISHDEAANSVARVLPQAVDKLTPDGKAPDLGSLQTLLGGLLGSK
jgi:uncharacterized protein YidB (DUF937 family)